MSRQYRADPNEFIPKPAYGNALGLSYEQPKTTRHLPPSPSYVHVNNGRQSETYAVTGTDRYGNPIYTKVYTK